MAGADAMIGSGDFLATLSSGVRSGNVFSNRGSAVLDAPERSRAAKEARVAGFKRGAAVTEMPLRREAEYDASDFADDTGEYRRRAQGGVRLSFRGGLLPKTLWGRIAAGCGLLLAAGCAIVAGLMVRSFLLRDPRFTVAGAQSIEIAGNSHLTRAQLLSVFGEDVDRNIFTIPLTERRAELERLPWVEHATVMRLLPDRVSVAIVERTPVAFVRTGTQIGLVDANGVLFDLPEPAMQQAGAGGAAIARGLPHYSFPVLTGISAADPLSTRAARMRIYMGFMAALDATGENISRKLSEVDVSSPEDVRAVVPDAGGDILVHFGEERFLERYHAYRDHLAEWRAQYPRLASADMRYERQVVLGMKPDTAASNAAGAKNTAASGSSAAGASAVSAAPNALPLPAHPAAATSAAGQIASPVKSKPVAVKTAHAATAKARSAARAKAALKHPAHTTTKATGQAPASRVALQGVTR